MDTRTPKPHRLLRATLFAALKFVGAAYLIWLGIGTLVIPPNITLADELAQSYGLELTALENPPPSQVVELIRF